MRAFGTTILMALVACIACIAAFYYYPKITVAAADDRVGQNLLSSDEEYDTQDVRAIKIDRFNKDQNASEKIELAQVGGSWVIPSKSNFLAGNAQRVSQAISAIRDKKVLEMVSDKQDDHEEYGVVEPSTNLGGAPSGVGTLLSLEDRSRRQLAKLIIGLPTTDKSKRFVRMPGQPQIYVIDFDNSILTTNFSDWVDGDLLRFNNQQWNLANTMSSVDIDYYFIEPNSLATTPVKKPVYRMGISASSNKWLYDLWKPESGEKLPEEPSVKAAEVNFETLRAFVGQMRNFTLRDVKKKSTAVAQHLAEPKSGASADQFNSLIADGFRHRDFSSGQHQFDSIAGHIRLAFATGLEVKIYVGNIAGLDIANRGDISRYMMILAGVNETLVPMPPKAGDEPGDANGADESADEQSGESDGEEKQSPQDDEARQRENQRLINERNAKLESARKAAGALNQLHADWIYVVPENTIEIMFPPSADAWSNTAPTDEHADHDHK